MALVGGARRAGVKTGNEVLIPVRAALPLEDVLAKHNLRISPTELDLASGQGSWWLYIASLFMCGFLCVHGCTASLSYHALRRQHISAPLASAGMLHALKP